MQIVPITPSVGAEVRGVAVNQLSDLDRAELRLALVTHKVLVLREQTITSPEYVDFISTFGHVIPDDLTPQAGHPPELGTIHIQPKERQTINFWHMDYSFRAQPTPVLSLYSRLLPECGGDTLFTNLEAAYDGLTDATKVQIEHLQCNHKVTETQNSAKRFTAEEFSQMVTNPPMRHPLVCTNPENGRRFLFVNVPIYCRSIVGQEDDEQANALLASLYAHASRPEFHFRLRWTQDTIVVWENTHCLHYPVADYFPHERRLWRLATQATMRPSYAAPSA